MCVAVKQCFVVIFVISLLLNMYFACKFVKTEWYIDLFIDEKTRRGAEYFASFEDMQEKKNIMKYGPKP